jgi:hypothetical protein
VRARVAVGFRGGKTRWGNGDQVGDVVAEGGLVLFDRQQIIGPVFEHQLAARLILGVERVQDHPAAGQFQLPEELTGHRDLVSLGIHQGAAQVLCRIFVSLFARGEVLSPRICQKNSLTSFVSDPGT